MNGEVANIKKWVVFYPVYINSKKTVAEGRRISLIKACENPTCVEIADCCSHFKLPNAIEIDKAYPRDFMQRGRVRVQLKKEDGTLYNPAISSSKYNFKNNLCQMRFLLYNKYIELFEKYHISQRNICWHTH
ncbi:hypothetical protein PTKIN_Ptkin18bG0089800 [Pterospermum kingtungense]